MRSWSKGNPASPTWGALGRNRKTGPAPAAPHFCDRYRNERFFLYDRTHQEALFYAEGRSAVRPLEYRDGPPDEAQARYRLLWKRFYDTIAIRERENPRCLMTHMPKRYWGTMTEFQGEAHFRARELRSRFRPRRSSRDTCTWRTP